MIGNGVDDALDRKHALRAAEAAKGHCSYRMRLACVSGKADIRQIIAIVGVKQRPVQDRNGLIQGIAVPRIEIEFDAEQQAVAVEPHVVVDEELVALAGDIHVVVAVQAAFRRFRKP